MFFRYKEIAGSLENAICDGLEAAPGSNLLSLMIGCIYQTTSTVTLSVFVHEPAGSAYHLQVSVVLWSCLLRCWSDKVYLSPLAHRFWKLTLQLYSRYAKFLDEVNFRKKRIDDDFK